MFGEGMSLLKLDLVLLLHRQLLFVVAHMVKMVLRMHLVLFLLLSLQVHELLRSELAEQFPLLLLLHS